MRRMVHAMTPTPPPAWTWPTHPDGRNMMIREMTPEDLEMVRRLARWRSNPFYENTLRYFKDEK